VSAISRREQIMLLACLAVVGIGGPLLFLAPGEGGTARTYKTERRKHEAVAAQLVQARAESNELRAAIDARVSPQTARQLMPRMVQAAQAAAKAAGVPLTDLKPMPAEAISGLERVPLQMTASTRFPQAARFLYEIQRQSDQYHVDQLRMTATDPQSDRLDIELRLVAYVRPEEEPHAAGS
jgi:Tfp pilus assembly protein PilO